MYWLRKLREARLDAAFRRERQRLRARQYERDDVRRFFEAVQNNDMREVGQLLDRDPTLVNVLGAGSTAIFEAAKEGYLDMVRLLVARGADANRPEEVCGSTALHAAASCDSADLVALILASGADPNPRDGSGLTPLFYADSDEVIAILMRHGGTD